MPIVAFRLPQERRAQCNDRDNVQIAPAEGKLGILIPGMGAVTTTFIAGVEAIRRGLAQADRSLTQMATIRLGKRTDGRSPKIKDFVPLAGLNDLVFGDWDIFEDNCLRSRASTPACWRRPLLEQLKRAALGDPADEGGLRSRNT